LIVYRFGADIFYANEARFVDEVERLVEQARAPVHHLVVDASAITAIDYSAARSVRQLMETLAARGVVVVFGRASSFLRSDMDRHGITSVVGPQRIFSTLHEALDYVHAAGAAGQSSL
jgi:sulfate permease, SulP family